MKKTGVMVLMFGLLGLGCVRMEKAATDETPEPSVVVRQDLVRAASSAESDSSVTELAALQRRADAILSRSNVSARKQIGTVFELADRLIQEGQAGLAEEYLARALQHEPWNLEKQLVYARLLRDRGEMDLFEEAAGIVFEYAETAELIEQAGSLLNEPASPDIPRIQTVPGEGFAVVLVPLQGCEPWILLRLQKKISDTLGVPVHLHRIEVEEIPCSRDRVGFYLNYVRKELFDGGLESEEVQSALKELGLSRQDLYLDENMVRLLRAIFRSAGAPAEEALDQFLKDGAGQDPQWRADFLLTQLFGAVREFRRERVAYLGITSEDIYSGDFNFLFGWANQSGGVMSTYRFTAAFNDERPSQSRLINRAYMQALSSIGHIYGVARCTNPTCARAYPNSLSEHDAKEGRLCRQCTEGFERVFAGPIAR